MDARRGTIWFAALALLAGSVATAQTPGGAIRLPAWVEPAPRPPIELTDFTPAPRPENKPLIEKDDLWLLLGKETSNQENVQQPASEKPTEPREPREFTPPTAELLTRQLEHAAGEAKDSHRLKRLIERYQRARPVVQAAGDRELLVRIDRVGSWAFESRGKLHAATGEYQVANVAFQKSLDLDESNHDARQALAVSLAEAGHQSDALQQLTRVLKSDPNRIVARQNRAAIYLARGNAEAAIGDCDAALQAIANDHPARAALLRLRGAALHNIGRLREAATDLNQAILLDPSDAAALTARGHVFAEGHFFEQAISDYSAAVHTDPSFAEAYRSLAWLLATCPEPKLRSPKVAIEAAWRARRLASKDDFLTLDASAAAHASAGEFDEAIRLQQRALLAAEKTPPAGASERLALYREGQPFVSR